MAIFRHVQPVYMPTEPPSLQQLEAVRQQFASRRDIPSVGMACDGTHIPFNPTDESTAQEYRNYKGWTSLLVVAFVN
eukprot:2406550-Pleurochrysis_carterae.AAC.1